MIAVINNKIKELRRRELVFIEQDNRLMTAVVRAQIECLTFSPTSPPLSPEEVKDV
jgi:hypothetical protein